jgi:hypothetical protein
MTAKTLKLSITKVTVTTVETSKLHIDIDGVRIGIDISAEVKAYFDQQFSRPNPTPQQKRKYATIMNLMRAAYLQGKMDHTAGGTAK